MAEPQAPQPEPSPSKESVVDWATFLAIHPPDKMRHVSGLGHHMEPRGPYFIIETPDLQLTCNSEVCGGTRTFLCTDGPNPQCRCNMWNWQFFEYRCRNCNETTKRYAVGFCWKYTVVPANPGQGDEDISGGMEALKLGEWPPLGPVMPKKLLKLIEPDAELFSRGRQAEGQGMGIGAFAYYRRVVENQRTRLFDKLIEAAVKLHVDATTIEALKIDRRNWQFSQSVAGLTAILPDSLKIQGHSPMALLHDALSHNLHNESDEVCLQAAQDIRLVLSNFAERLHYALKDQGDLEKAVGRLTNSRPSLPT